MKLKRVSFEVAKALRAAGYPQGYTSQCYLTADHNQFYHKGQIVDEVDEWRLLTGHLADIPTYLDAWLWLWREKKVELSFSYGPRLNDIDETLFCFPLEYHAKSHPNMKHIIQEMNYASTYCSSHGHRYGNHEHADPEEAIIAAIDYIVSNNLIK